MLWQHGRRLRVLLACCNFVIWDRGGGEKGRNLGVEILMGGENGTCVCLYKVLGIVRGIMLITRLNLVLMVNWSQANAYVEIVTFSQCGNVKRKTTQNVG